MHNYLSFGAGVNSVALYLLMVEQGIEFEAVFSDTGCEWPETYSFLDLFIKNHPVTVLKTEGLIEYCEKYGMVPHILRRWCTRLFKREVINGYVQQPSWMFIGFSSDEAHRAKLTSDSGLEYRYPLIENEITRAGCIEIIRKAGLPIPRKSGCYICPFQRVGQWQELRRYHPELFCRASNLEKANIAQRIARGKKPLYLSQSPKAPLSEIVGERQEKLFKQDEYPPCLCGL